MKNFSNSGSIARGAAVATFSRLGTWWRRRVRTTALVLIALLSANCVGQNSAAQAKSDAALTGLGLGAKSTLVATALVATVGVIGVGVYVVIQHAHTVRGCVTDDPNGLMLHTEDGKIYVLLGATTHIKADTRIKVRGTKKKKITGVTDQPSFVVEKVGKTYGTCSVPPANP